MTKSIEIYRELIYLYNPILYDCKNDGLNANRYYNRGETPLIIYFQGE